MSHSLLKKNDKYDTNLRPHNMVMSNYKGKTNKEVENENLKKGKDSWEKLNS